jgi:hypothetical protein
MIREAGTHPSSSQLARSLLLSVLSLSPVEQSASAKSSKLSSGEIRLLVVDDSMPFGTIDSEPLYSNQLWPLSGS